MSKEHFTMKRTKPWTGASKNWGGVAKELGGRSAECVSLNPRKENV